MSTCSCPKHTVNGVVQTAGLDVFCPMHGRRTETCPGCIGRDLRIAELEAKLAAYSQIVQTPVQRITK